MKWLFGLIAAVAVATAALWAHGYANRAGPHEYAAVDEATRERAKAYLDASTRPLPDGWRWSVFEPEAGVALRVGRVSVPTPKGIVVVVPGYTAPVDLYSDTVRAFVDAGYDVAGFEYRGQGLSHRELDNPEMGYVGDWRRLGADLAAYLETLKGDGPIFVYANSMGAHVALRAAHDAVPEVAGYVLTVPMVKIDTGGVPYSVARVMTGFYDATGLGGELTVGQVNWKPDRIAWDEGTPCNTNPATAWRRDALFALNEPMRTTGTTNAWVARTTASSDELMTPAFAARIDKPVLMVTAGKEAFVDTPAAAGLCDAMVACERVHYPDSSHCIADEKPGVGREIRAKAVAFADRIAAQAASR